ncbi:hypothetical protein QNK12_16885 [Neobacillus cucumis]|nr:hypothetical protein QNK12_16885 [Neobacillus cucumis]
MNVTERVFFVSFLSSLLYTILIGGAFIYLFIFTYDFFYGEKRDKQMKKIHKHFRKETVKKIDLLEHQPKKFTMYQVKTNSETKKVKVKPGYKIVKMVKKKK